MAVCGMVGVGQLGNMLADAASSIEQPIVFYNSSNAQPLPQIHQTIYTQQQAEEFLKTCDVVTYENENISADLLERIQQHATLRPGMRAIGTAQDRLLEKQCFGELGIPTNDYVAINSSQDLTQAAQRLGFPFIIKTRREGYDGKGQTRVYDQQGLDTLLAQGGFSDCIAESWVGFEYEVSIIATRNAKGEIVFFPMTVNTHKEGILWRTDYIAGHLPESLINQAQNHIQKLLTHFDYVGTCALELFVTAGNALVANEIAPRVHNTGHWTIEGTNVSQFENHIRAVMDLPLVTPKALAPVVSMLNVIGEHHGLQSGQPAPGVFVHMYQKSAQPRRKLGHVSCVAQSESQLIEGLEAYIDTLPFWQSS